MHAVWESPVKMQRLNALSSLAEIDVGLQCNLTHAIDRTNAQIKPRINLTK